MNALEHRGQLSLNWPGAPLKSYILERPLKNHEDMFLVRLADTANPKPKTAWAWAVLYYHPDRKVWTQVAGISTPGRAGGAADGYFRVWAYIQHHRFEGHMTGEIAARDLMVHIMEFKA